MGRKADPEHNTRYSISMLGHGPREAIDYKIELIESIAVSTVEFHEK